MPKQCGYPVDYSPCIHPPGHAGPHRNADRKAMHETCGKTPPAAITNQLPARVDARCDRFARHGGPCAFVDQDGRRVLFKPARATPAGAGVPVDD